MLINVVVTLSHIFHRTSDGAVWTKTQHEYSLWARYLHVFDRVRVVARIKDVLSSQADWKRADGDGVEFAFVAPFNGFWQFIQKARNVQQVITNSIRSRDAVVLFTYATISAASEPLLRHTGHPYGIQVGSDPYYSFSPGAIKHPLRPFFRWWFVHQLQRQCAGACAAAYVTEKALQRRYPPAPGAFSTHYSDVELPEDAFVPAPRPHQTDRRRFTLVFVGGLARFRKAPDVLIDAVAVCVQGGLNLKLILVGGGEEQAELEARAAALDLSERVRFRGNVPAGQAVRAELDQADLFVLPSRAEGKPRAMIEAMARALPCIGSNVSGIPELLSPENTVPPGDVTDLANKIREIVTNPERMTCLSARNLEKAKDYKEEILRPRWIAFYRAVRERTEAWLETQGQ